MFGSLLKGVIYRLTYQLAIFIAGLFIATLAGPSQFGIISLLIVNGAAFMILSGLGTDASIVWHLAGRSVLPSKALSFALFTGILQLALFFITQFIVIRLTGLTLLSRQVPDSVLIYESLYFLGLVLIEKYISLLYGNHKANSANKWTTITATVFLLLLLLSYIGALVVPGLLIFYSIMVLSIGITLAILFHSTLSVIPGKLNSLDIRSLLSFSAIVFLTNVIQFFAYRFDFWVVDHFSGHGELGIYAQATRFAQLMWVIPAIIAGLLLPALRKNEQPVSNIQFNGVLRFMTFVNIVIVALIVLFAWALYKWFLQPEYSGGWIALLYMLPGYFLFAVTTILAAWFSARRLLVINLIGSTICFILIGIIDLLLIPRYSFRGAAIANTIAYSATTVYFIYQYCKISPATLKELFIWRKEDTPAIRSFVNLASV